MGFTDLVSASFEFLSLFLSPLRGLFSLASFTHGLRLGLYSCAASRLVEPLSITSTLSLLFIASLLHQ
jgi:hypothetical protein